ncbi:MAG: 5-formyltetrahydrofolate cyclo-ligase [Pseudohongiellaceae bacterium]
MNNIYPDPENRSRLRKTLRQRRQSLSSAEQRLAATRLYHLLIHDHLFLRAERVGFYFPGDGEIDPMSLLLAALRMRKKCYLPLLSPHRPDQVSFARFEDGDILLPNRWGIPEPLASARHCAPSASLNLVLVPLVGFDESGARLGMGKGFYDRTFSFKRRLGTDRPRLVGLAHECQKAERIPVSDWDVPLDAVVTDKKIYRF